MTDKAESPDKQPEISTSEPPAPSFPLGDMLSDDRDEARRAPAELSAKSVKGVIMLMHGFDPFYPIPSSDPRTALYPFMEEMRQYYEPRGYRVYINLYPTNVSFVTAATFVQNNMLALGVPLHNVHMFGYSMGGLVCRQLVANGFIKPSSLMTYCTPNLGTAAWITWYPYNLGAMSMWQSSHDLAVLNNNPTDISNRHNYTMIGISYEETGSGKRHYNDQLVEVNSAILNGNNCGPKPGRPIHWSYYKPHNVEIGTIHSACQGFPMIRAAMNQFIATVPD
ncbi:esterase/lipase family protein [Aquisalinus flavus]|uniref:Alpha/beta hydrolase n=1 Tax=Aquisalinus flavus TaxID=1526572 RepID=A0A8J2V3E0_9PROT|nr:hypothetical protein [Aquisalinus flavus]MBD0425581.1 hypothetical protein [Aquisalinus flavus]UNE48796.1 alpha/beta hydrolase [Aquisalinus flavus]GGD14907.1 hypothetical protein GCM10011342_24620 [Aquisalinus flavus]